MTSGVDRLAAAAAGHPCDRIPVFCNLLDQGAREMGVPMRTYYQSPELVAEAQLRMRERWGYDNLWSLFYVGKEAEFFGCRDILFADDGPPNVAEFVIGEPADIARLHVPDDIFGHPAFDSARRCIGILRAESGGRWPICAYLTASMSLPAMLMGMDKWLALLMMGPFDLRDALLEKCSDFFRKQVAAYRAAGADVLLYSNPFGSLDIVTPRMFRQLSLPWMKRDLGPVGVKDMVYYCGSARINKVMEDVISELGMSAFYISPLEDVAEAKRIAAGRALIAGTIDDIKIANWTPDQVRAEVRRVIEAGMPGGRFLFGTLLMPLSIPEINIAALLDAAFDAGRGGWS
ncbi:MAG: uroporphyrinogen decarboxylase family protein [Actinomycetota bacterium]